MPELTARLAGHARRGLALISLSLIAGCALVGGSAEELRHPDDPPPRITLGDLAQSEIRAAALRQHMQFLRSTEGRQAGPVSGADRAAAWLVSQFQLAGLVPAGEGGGYVQYWWPEPSDTIRAPNVVARLRGADPDRADEPIIVLARFGPLALAGDDTTGATTTPESVASAAVLAEVARALAALPARLPRPILFVAVSGTREGWEGARVIAERPEVILASAGAVLALGTVDAYALAGTEREGGAALLAVAGHGDSSLGPLLEGIVAEHRRLRFRVRRLEAEQAGVTLPALEPFMGLGVPGVVVWAHASSREAELGGSDRDGNPDLAARLARLIFLATHRAASGAVPPLWPERRMQVNDGAGLP
jgi:hypothetical protein